MKTQLKAFNKLTLRSIAHYKKNTRSKIEEKFLTPTNAILYEQVRDGAWRPMIGLENGLL